MERDTNRANHWNEVAWTYEEARPSYPNQLIEDIIAGARLAPGASLLEIGAGTGKATVQLAEKGFRIHCVEPGQNLADILMEKCSCYPGVTVDVAWFEEWTPAENAKFDLVLCAQAFNWLDPEIRFRKCHDLLKEDGHLAMFWYAHENEPWASEIVASGLFAEPQVCEYRSELTSSPEVCIKALE